MLRVMNEDSGDSFVTLVDDGDGTIFLSVDGVYVSMLSSDGIELLCVDGDFDSEPPIALDKQGYVKVIKG